MGMYYKRGFNALAFIALTLVIASVLSISSAQHHSNLIYTTKGQHNIDKNSKTGSTGAAGLIGCICFIFCNITICMFNTCFIFCSIIVFMLTIVLASAPLPSPPGEVSFFSLSSSCSSPPILCALTPRFFPFLSFNSCFRALSSSSTSSPPVLCEFL